MKSNILFQLTKEIEVQGKKLVSYEYITNLYVYTKTPSMCLFFRKDTNKLYTIDKSNLKLLEIPKNIQHLNQISQLKKMILSLNIEETKIDKQKTYKIQGKGENVILNVEIKTQVIEELERTVNYNSYLLSQDTSFFDLEIPANELVKTTSFIMNVQGNEVKSKLNVRSINRAKNSIDKYDYIYKYQH